jgi:hypothetical protein
MNPPLRIHTPPEENADRQTTWKINGWPVNVVIWTADEWARLHEKPPAQYYPDLGLWCALKVV